jgi:hypothetical protein
MSRTFVLMTFAAALCAAALVGCQSDTVSAAAGEGVVSGTVYDAVTHDPLASVSVKAMSASAGTVTATTGTDGNYVVKFTVDSMMTVIVTFSKSGYNDTTITATLRSASVTPANINLTPRSGIIPPGSGSGIAQTIAFLGASPSEISVYGVGGKETSVLQWEVRDSLGLPIDAQHAVALNFSSINGPNGGEYISPIRVTTNATGQAGTTFNAGTRSGVVQVLASATVGGRTISSSPVQIVIQGGFPVQSHFSIASTQHNFPAMDYVGRMLPISILAGDVYSNPVAAGTAVYFRSSAGVIQPSVFTSKDGQGSVELISGNPQPMGSYAAVAYGNGYHFVVARTLGQGGVAVEDSILILWTGLGSISAVNPTTFDIANTGSQTFTFVVADGLGHPLAQGTNISVNAAIPPPPSQGMQQNQVFVVFGNNGTVSLGDEIFPGLGTTQFSFTLKDGTWGITDATPVNVTITVAGPNTLSALNFTIAGIVH